MIRFFLFLYKLSYGTNEKNHYKRSNRLKWLICIITFVAIKFSFFYYMKLRGQLKISPSLKGPVNENIIVSLTSFPARINNVWMVLDSICRQDMRPKSINLYLALEEFPNKEIPVDLKKYDEYGLNICWVDKNLKPHNKYYYALKDNPDKYIISIDDDIYYRDDMISRLWKISQSNKGCVCANRATKILDEALELKKYTQWGVNQSEPYGASFNYLALGTCGVIYPPSLLRETEMFNAESIIKYCMKADDLWLKCHEILNKIPVATGEFYSQSIEIMGSQKISLRSTNCDDTEESSGNDIQWRNLDNEYHMIERLTELVKQENHIYK